MSSTTKRLAPWEEIVYFDTPKTTVITLSAAQTWEQIAPANPQRVALFIGSVQGVNVSPDSTISAQSGGIPLGSTTPPILLTEASHGPLCTMAWYASGNLSAVVTVIEVVLRHWPEGQQ